MGWQTVVNGQSSFQNTNSPQFSISLQQTTTVQAKVQNGACDPLLSGEAIFVVNVPSLGTLEVVNSLEVDEYDGYSYQVETPDGVSLKDGFFFLANENQSFFVLLDKNYSAPQDQNYVLEETVLTEGVLSQDALYFANAYTKQSSFNYFDGLGRLMQNVNRKNSPTQQDLITPVTYDQVGRIDKNYLPFSAGKSDGQFMATGVSAQSNFYLFPPSKVEGTDFPYAQKIIEPSPLDRLLEQGSPGDNWQPGTGHTVQYGYDVNYANEALRWGIDPASNLPVSQGYFSAGDLAIKITTDENGHQVKEYQDKLGLSILKRVLNQSSYVDTYYIYDDQSLLRFVIQPEGVSNLSGNPDQTFLDNWAFQYTYDSRRRIITKKIPGAAPIFMVYDNRDRLVLTQDGNQRALSQWSFTKYDQLNRPIVQGIYTSPQQSLSQSDMSTLISTDQFTESYVGNSPIGYTTNRVFPTDNLQVMTVNFYDNYALLEFFGSGFQYDYTHLTGLPNPNFGRVLGLPTGKMVRIIDSETFLRSVIYYDQRYRQIQVLSENHLGGIDRVSNLFDFGNHLISQKTTHQIKGSSIDITEDFTYDHAGRLLAQYHTIGSGPKLLLKQPQYNEIGQTVTKNIHATDQGFLQTEDFRYNIRGWLTSINNATLSNDGGVTNEDSNDLFGFQLNYDQTGNSNSTPQFNGNISETMWKSLGNHQQRFAFNYDPLNRLTESDYSDLDDPTRNDRYDEKILQYDGNGNIVRLQRTGLLDKPGLTDVMPFGLMDDMTYDYSGMGNQLRSVTDYATNTTSYEGGFIDGNKTGDDYAYDANGNLTMDNNKSISTITYNYLNLPKTVSKTTGESINFIYDATGTKLSQKVTQTNSTKTTDYVKNFVYENSVLCSS